jgi:hypothetical protein
MKSPTSKTLGQIPLRPVAGLATLALIFAACGGGGDDAADTTVAAKIEESTTTSTTEKATTTTEAKESSTTSTTVPLTPRQPLTGQPLANEDEIIDRAAMVVKIDNVSARQNHTGLAVADIVFEEIVEGDATRFAAVFHSQSSDPIGPIRSGRTQDINLFMSFNMPLFVWSGGNAGVTFQINQSTLINMSPSNASGYYRGPGSAPHNLYNNTDGLWAQTPEDQPGAPGQQYVYLEEGEQFEGDATAGVDLRVGHVRVEWDWNAETGKFDRSQDGSLHQDKTHGQIAASNVVIMGVQYQPSVVDRRSPEAQTIGEGPAYIFSDGQVIEGRWQREFNLFAIDYFDADGERVAFNVGNTWIELAREVPTLDPEKTGVDMIIKPPAS